MNVCIFAASSRRPDPEYFHAARVLGKTLAEGHAAIRYGGGSVGLMGEVANAALAAGGHVTGVIPRFMVDLEWGHDGVSEEIIVETMAERKALLSEGTDAVIALAGGMGTLEELLEVLTLKQLGLYLKPVILINTRGYYDRLVDLLHHGISEGFLGEQHAGLWTILDDPTDIFSAIQNSIPWSKDYQKSAQL